MHAAGRVAGPLLQVMGRGLGQNALPDGLAQRVAVKAAEGNFLRAVKAALQLSVRRYADAAAAAAKGVAHGTDQPYGTLGPRQTEPPHHSI